MMKILIGFLMPLLIGIGVLIYRMIKSKGIDEEYANEVEDKEDKREEKRQGLSDGVQVGLTSLLVSTILIAAFWPNFLGIFDKTPLWLKVAFIFVVVRSIWFFVAPLGQKLKFEPIRNLLNFLWFIAIIVVLVALVSGWKGDLKTPKFDWFKKTQPQIKNEQPQNSAQPFFVFQDTIKKVLPEWNIIKHQFYLGNTIIILSSSGNLNYKKSWEAGDGRKFEMKLRNDGLYWGQIPIKYQILDPNTRYQVKINNYKGGEKLIFWIK
ncbi:hypothetical protein KKA66_02690 [Patescibacteria group bacterium]|nr:hypothetical protein [Patescibacteria group bacterium]